MSYDGFVSEVCLLHFVRTIGAERHSVRYSYSDCNGYRNQHGHRDGYGHYNSDRHGSSGLDSVDAQRQSHRRQHG